MWLALLPAIGGLIMAGGLVTMGLLSRRQGGAGSFYIYLSLPLLATSVLVGFYTYFHQKNKYRRTIVKREARYKEVLEKYNGRIGESYDSQKDAIEQPNPSPQACLERVEGVDHRLWERSYEDPDFLFPRLGTGDMPLAVEVNAPDQEVALDPDPLITRAQELADSFSPVKDVPILLPLRAAGVAGLAGPRGAVLDTARALLVQLAASHPPDEVKIAAIFPADEGEDWGWARWLPHTWTEDRSRRLLADSRESAHELFVHLYDLLNRRQFREDGAAGKGAPLLPCYVVFLADPDLAEGEPALHLLLSDGPRLGAFPIFLGDDLESLPRGCSVIAQVEEGKGSLLFTEKGEGAIPFTLDAVGAEPAERFSRAMAPIQLKGASKASEIPAKVDLLDLWGTSDVRELEADLRWSYNHPYDSLAVPIGMKAGGNPLLFDLHEKAHGPHGLVAGATGSGKSELLQSIIGALAVHFHPHEVAFVIVDYKGGGMSNAFLQLPHLMGVMTNLQGNLATRALIALKSELGRRQQLLAGMDVNHIDAYQRKWRGGETDVPLPHLIIVIDEFAELKSEQPDFMKELVSTVRLGRSLGVHLILATQKPSGIVDEQIWGNTKFRICLRVERTEDSAEVLKRPDAANINLPGRAYLQVGNNELFELFQSAYSGAPYSAAAPPDADERASEVLLDGTRLACGKPVEKKAEAPAVSQIQAVEAYLHDLAEIAGVEALPAPWLPPLPEAFALDALMRGLSFGWDGHTWIEPPVWMEPVIGLVDDPAHQYQGPLTLPLGISGNLAIYGMPGSGKTTLLQTLIVSLARLHGPQDLNIYILDFGGRTLGLFAPLPQVGDVVFEDDAERMQGLIRLLLQELGVRKGLFSAAGVNTLPAYREATGERLPAILVILDNYSNFYTMYEESLEDTFSKLIQEGGNAGIIFVMAANDPLQIRTMISANISQVITLQLSENASYTMALGNTGGLYPDHFPGRGMIKGAPPLEFQTALPAAAAAEAERANLLREWVKEVAAAWEGARAPAIPVLPQCLYLSELADAFAGRPHDDRDRWFTPLGISSESLQVVGMDLREGPHFLVSGPPQSGKTNLLRAWGIAACLLNPPDGLHLYLVDFGRSSFAFMRELPHVSKYVADAEGLTEAIEEISVELGSRQQVLQEAVGEEGDAGEGGLPASMPVLLMLVDDFHLFKGGLNMDCTDALEQMASRGRGLGFHLVLSGASSDLSSCWDEYFKAIAACQSGCLLGGNSYDDLQVFNARLEPGEPECAFASGVGYLVRKGRLQKVKTALAQSEDIKLTDWTERIMRLHGDGEG